MTRLVREFEEIRNVRSLDSLIDQLSAVRAKLPDPATAEVKMRGDDVFGRRLSIVYLRPQTREEAACDARYMNSQAAPWLREYAREA